MNTYHRLTTILAATLALAPLAGCGGSAPGATNGTSLAREAAEPANAEGHDLLGGTWEVGAITYKGKILSVDAVDSLADLYDNEVLGFSSDGTFEQRIGGFIFRGTYEPYEDERTFLLKNQTSSRMTIEDGKMIETEPKESNEARLLTLVDSDDNTFSLVEFDPMTGKAKADGSPLYYVKSGEESSFISGEKADKSVSSTESKKTGTTTPSSPTTTTSVGNQEAVDRATRYLSTMPFSYEGLIAQLEFEGYSHADATHAVDACGADWEAQALLKAKRYLESQAFSKSGLQQQLEFEKFTTKEAQYGVDNCGADWNEQAALKARQYKQSMSLSGSRLIEQLEFEGFTHAQAVYGVEHAR